jgi:S1-C subfamily serine protease
MKMKKFNVHVSHSLLFFTLLSIITLAIPELHELYLYNHKGSSVVMLYKEGRGGGTGFLVQADSGNYYTMTNKHVCMLGDDLLARKWNGEEQHVKVIEMDKEHDLCIMSPVSGISPLSLGSAPSIHDRVYLIGHPGLRGLTLEKGRYIGMSYIDVMYPCEIDENENQVSKLLEQGNFEDAMKLMQYSACVIKFEADHINTISYGGNSGSPILNTWGNVVGVLFAGSLNQPTATYAVPYHSVVKFLEGK